MSTAKSKTIEETRIGALKKLEVFVDRWSTKGQQYEGAIGPAVEISAVETYEWLDGGCFLIHHFDGHVGNVETACLEIIGYDAQNQSYPVHTYYGNGLTNEWQYRERDGIWTLTGGWETDGKTVNVRCTITFGDGGDIMTGKWELSTDSPNWQRFWKVKATRAR